MKKRNYDQKEFICDCPGGKKCDRLTIQAMGDRDANIDIWTGKKLRGGVYLKPGSLKELIKFLIKLNK